MTWLENERLKGEISDLADDVKVSLAERQQVSDERDTFESAAVLYKDKCDQLSEELNQLKPLITEDLAHVTEQLNDLKEEKDTEIEALSEQLQFALQKVEDMIDEREAIKCDLHKKCDEIMSSKIEVEKQLHDTEQQYHDIVDKLALLARERDDIVEQNSLQLTDLKDRLVL